MHLVHRTLMSKLLDELKAATDPDGDRVEVHELYKLVERSRDAIEEAEIAAQRFIDKVDEGLARSKDSYRSFKTYFINQNK